MIKVPVVFFLPTALCVFQSCAPTSGGYSYAQPVYSVYRPPLVVDFDDYHSHGDHHHHHDDDQRTHYHPDNKWDRIAYDTANKALSSSDIANINQLGNSTSKKTSKKKSQ